MNDNNPNLFIVGAAKAGTTSVYNYIQQHPQVYMSPIKEPHFFGSDIQWENFTDKRYKQKIELNMNEYLSKKPLKSIHLAYVNKLEDYLQLFDGSEQFKIRGESSTSYLFSKFAAKEIYRFNKDAKIIILLRNPVERALSHYFMDVTRGMQEVKNVQQAIQRDYTSTNKGWGNTNLYIELSLYYEQVKRYLDVFGKPNVLILRYEDLKDNRNDVLLKIFNFLQIPFYNDIKTETVFNETLVPKNNMVNKLKLFKKILPDSFTKTIKNNIRFMFKARKDLIVGDEVKAYIESLVAADWRLTQALIAPQLNSFANTPLAI